MEVHADQGYRVEEVRDGHLNQALVNRMILRPRPHNNGRAKTSAHSVVAPFRFASPCAGFEPFAWIRLAAPAGTGLSLWRFPFGWRLYRIDAVMKIL
jgi:hypothetical protein